MRVVVVAVGKVKERPLRAALDDYLGRIRRYAPCDEIRSPFADAPAAKLAPLFDKHTKDATTVALEIGGRALDSGEFSRALGRMSAANKGIVAFLIGGADGLPPLVSAVATDRWSLSPLTFPHRLARLVLVEQIYRALTMLRGEPYAH